MGETFEDYKARRERERESRLMRMAGNIAAGLVKDENGVNNPEWVAKHAVATAVAIDAEVTRVVEKPPRRYCPTWNGEDRCTKPPGHEGPHVDVEGVEFVAEDAP